MKKTGKVSQRKINIQYKSTFSVSLLWAIGQDSAIRVWHVQCAFQNCLLEKIINPSAPIFHWLRAPLRALNSESPGKVHLGQVGSHSIGKGQRQKDNVSQVSCYKLQMSLNCTELSSLLLQKSEVNQGDLAHK